MEKAEEGNLIPNGQPPAYGPEELFLCAPAEHHPREATEQLSLHETRQHSICDAGGVALDITPAGEPSLFWQYSAAEHPQSVARELALCFAGEHLSCEAGEAALHQEEGIRSSDKAGTLKSYAAGEHPSPRAEELPSYEIEGNTLKVAGEFPSSRTGEPPSYETGVYPPRGAGEHEVQHGHSRENNSTAPLCSRIALLIFCIVALNIGMFFVIMYINDCPQTSASCFLPFLHRLSFQPLHENMLIGPSSQTLVRLGALDVIKVQHAHQGWRLVSCIWLHAGVVHVLVNMISLLSIGIRLEQEFGAVRIGMIYLLSGFGGSLLSTLFLKDVSVGASGALFGLVGAMLSELLTNWTIYSNKCAVMTILIFVVAANLAMGIFPFVDNFAHIGGLLVGFLSGFVLLMKPQYGYVKPASLPSHHTIQSSIKAKYRGYQYVLWVVALILLIAGIAYVAVLVFQGVDGNKNCRWCHYLSCVPTSKWDCHNSIACDKLQMGNEWKITCISNHKTTLAPMNQSAAMLQELCMHLCT